MTHDVTKRGQAAQAQPPCRWSTSATGIARPCSSLGRATNSPRWPRRRIPRQGTAARGIRPHLAEGLELSVIDMILLDDMTLPRGRTGETAAWITCCLEGGCAGKPARGARSPRHGASAPGASASRASAA
jgi:hypothetical protein